MKITCTQENLARSLAYLERATGKQSTLPILSNFLLSGGKGGLKLSATNLEIGVISVIGAKIEGNGEIAVPVKIVSNFVHNLPLNGIIILDLDGRTLSLESGGYKMKIRGLDPKDFPIIPEKKGSHLLSLPAQEFKVALQRLLPCVSVNESRIELTGVNMLFLEKELHIAATDSFRLAEQIIPLPDDRKGSGYADFSMNIPSLILPQMAMQEISRIISPDSKEIQFAFEENQVFFDVDGVSLVSRVINGKYPDYKQILPKKFSYTIKISRDELLRSVRMAGIFSSQMHGEMLLSLSSEKGELAVSSQSSDIGENKTILPVEVTGSGSLEMLFNPRYILDGLNVLDSEYILLSANSGTTPIELRAVHESMDAMTDGFLYIAMPVRK
jgi:DNA polymerase-3 subunit beta